MKYEMKTILNAVRVVRAFARGICTESEMEARLDELDIAPEDKKLLAEEYL